MSEIQKRNVPPRLLVQLSFARRRCVRDASVYFRSTVANSSFERVHSVSHCLCSRCLRADRAHRGRAHILTNKAPWIASPIQGYQLQICAVHGAARVFYSNAVRCVLRARILELAWPAWL